MKIKIKDGVIMDEFGTVIGETNGNCTEIHIRHIELGADLVPMVEKFVDSVNQGSFKPKKTVNEFEQLLKMHQPFKINGLFFTNK